MWLELQSACMTVWLKEFAFTKNKKLHSHLKDAVFMAHARQVNHDSTKKITPSDATRLFYSILFKKTYWINSAKNKSIQTAVWCDLVQLSMVISAPFIFNNQDSIIIKRQSSLPTCDHIICVWTWAEHQLRLELLHRGIQMDVKPILTCLWAAVGIKVVDTVTVMIGSSLNGI